LGLRLDVGSFGVRLSVHFSNAAQMVVATERVQETIGLAHAEVTDLGIDNPVAVTAGGGVEAVLHSPGAQALVVGLAQSAAAAETSRRHIFRVGNVVVAHVGVGHEHCHIDPRGGLPPRIVVAFFRALQTVTLAVGVLTGATLIVAVDVLVRLVQTGVAAGVLATVVECDAFVHVELSATVRAGLVEGQTLGGGTGAILRDGLRTVVVLTGSVGELTTQVAWATKKQKLVSARASDNIETMKTHLRCCCQNQ